MIVTLYRIAYPPRSSLYRIFQGEARVIKRLTPGTVDVKARRKKIRAILDRESPHQRTKKLLDFISERDYSKWIDKFIDKLLPSAELQY